MFSSLNFSNLIPSGLSLGPSTPSQEKAEVGNVEDNDTDAEDNLSNLAGSTKDTKPKKKEKQATETFVFVRPPPAKSNHPLNLQVQLVPPKAPGQPNSVTGTPRQSGETDREVDIADDTNGAPLSRVSSSVSGYSQASAPVSHGPSASTTSFSSATSASSTSSRRVIIPLYNLQAHNVMTNTIVDAGTDAKIARFTRKGLEMVELGMLECTEVWATKNDTLPQQPTTEPPPNTLPPMLADIQEPTSSTTSLSSSSAQQHSSTLDHASVQEEEEPPVATPVFSKRQAFKNLFKSSSATPVATPNGHLRTPARVPVDNGSPRGLGHNKRLSTSSMNFSFKRDRSSSPNPSFVTGTGTSTSRGASPRGSTEDPHHQPNTPTPNQQNFSVPSTPQHSGFVPPAIVVPPSDGPQTVGFVTSKDTILLPATLGIQPSLNSLLPFPLPFALVNNERGSDRAKVQLPPNLPYKLPRGPAMYVWIVRRWLKQSFVETPQNLMGFNLRGFNGEAGPRGKGMSEVEVRYEWTKRAKSNKLKKKNKDKKSIDNISTTESRKSRNRRSVASVMSISTDGGAEKEKESGYDSGEESDPEDSETPWNCVVKVRKVHGGGSVVKLKLGSLSPTPHHPKVVGMLKVPYPLPDIHFLPPEEGGVMLKKREGFRPDDSKSIVLSTEEIKDTLCSTGMWLVVREGFGGVGRVGRKGDGWRIRA